MSLVIIGKLYKISGDEENPTVTELDGWHVNSTEPVAEWEQWLIPHVPPRPVFSGVDTYCYKFDSEEQFKALLPEPDA